MESSFVYGNKTKKRVYAFVPYVFFLYFRQLEDNQITAVNGKMFEGLTSLSTL